MARSNASLPAPLSLSLLLCKMGRERERERRPAADTAQRDKIGRELGTRQR